MTALLEQQPAARIDLPSLSQHPECLMTTLRIVNTDTGQQIRRMLSEQALADHTHALKHSIELEELGKTADVELPSYATYPHIVGAEVLCVMALARKQVNRELGIHPEDQRKRIIKVR